MSEQIPAGYQLHITTWENDGDSYKTKILNGLKKEDVDFYLSIVKNFTSKNDHRRRGYGNGSINEKDLENIISNALATSPHLSKDIRDVWDAIPENPDYKSDWNYESLTELLGTPEQYDDLYFCRVFESFKVYYIPTHINEVTSEFK